MNTRTSIAEDGTTGRHLKRNITSAEANEFHGQEFHNSVALGNVSHSL